jgi:hypothetical protein
MSYGRIAVRTYTALYLAVRLQSDRSVNDSTLTYLTFAYRDIFLFYRRLHERICYTVFSNDNTTGGIFIETVQRAEGIALSPALLIISYDVGQSIELMYLYGMYGHTVGLIDYEQAVIFKEDIQTPFYRFSVVAVGRQLYLYDISVIYDIVSFKLDPRTDYAHTRVFEHGHGSG